jgi:hypothetical protein
MIVLGIILVVTLACVEHNLGDDSPTRTPRADDPTKVPTSSLYYTTTAGSITRSEWGWWQGSVKTTTCTANDVQVELTIWPATGEVYLNTSYHGFDTTGEPCARLSGMTGGHFDGSPHEDGSRVYVHFDTCGSNTDWTADGTAVSDALINLLHLDDLTYDDVFIGGATCNWGTPDYGYSESYDFTVYYQGEYKP